MPTDAVIAPPRAALSTAAARPAPAPRWAVATAPLAAALLAVFVQLNLSEVLVRFHGLPSLLQLLAPPLAAVAVALAGWRGVEALVTEPLTLAVGLYWLVLAASTTWAFDVRLADERLVEMAKATMIFALVALLAATPRLLRVSAWAAVAGGALLAALGVWQALTGFGSELGGLARVKQAQIYGDVFEPRSAGPLGDPNFFAQILLALVPVALALAWEDRRRRPPALAAAALLVAGTVLTYSRGAAVALALVLGLALVVRGVRARHLALGTALLALLVVAAPAGFTQRLETLQEMLPGGQEQVLEPDSSFAKRRLVTGAAWQMFLDHPVAGVGVANYGTRFMPYADRVGTPSRLYEGPGERNFPHSLYLEVAAETGVLGLAAFFLVVLAAFTTLVEARRRLLRAGDRRTAALAEGVGLALVGLLLTGLFLHGEFPRYLYFFLGLTAGLGTVAARATGGGRLAATRAAMDEAPEWAPEETRTVQLRRPVAMLVSRFPLVTETFILREVQELERQGQPVRLVPLMRERPEVVHREAEPWVARALYTPWLSPAIAAANLRALARRPRAWAGTLARLVVGSRGGPGLLARSLALFPKAVYLGERLAAEGVRHLHAQFATHPTTVALVACRTAPPTSDGPLTFSFTVHAHDLFVDRRLLAWKLRQARRVRLISEFNRGYVEERYPGVAGKLEVVHVGVPAEHYAPPAEDGRAGAAVAGPPVVLCVAAHKEYKGLPVLVEACRRLRERGVEFRCELMGDGPLRGEVEAAVAAAGLEGTVAVLGAQRQDEVARRMSAAAVLALPSVVARDGQMEGIPVALMEALAAERAVVASDLSGIPELVVDGETGLLAPPGDAGALADALERLLRDPALRGRLGRAGRQRVEQHFSLPGTVAELLALLDRDNPPPPAAARRLAAAGLEVEGLAAERLVVEGRAAKGAATGGPVAGEVVAGERAAEARAGHAAAGLRRLHRGRDAEVVELLLPAAARAGGAAAAERVVKRHLDRPGASRPARARAAREAAVAARVAEWDGAPAVLGVDEALAVVAFAPCPGRPLDEMLRRGRRWPWSPLRRHRRRRRELAAAVAAAGRWLARYQATPLEDVLAGDGLNGDAGPPWWKPARPTARVPVHGDLWPGNLRIETAYDAADVAVDGAADAAVSETPDEAPDEARGDGGRAVARALDFEGACLGPAEADAAWFLLHMDLYLDRPGLSWLRRRLHRAFLAGWRRAAGAGAELDPRELAAARAAAARHLLRTGEEEGAFAGLRGRWRQLHLAVEAPAEAASAAKPGDPKPESFAPEAAP